MKLPSPARYTPWISGKYEVSANIKPLGTDYGNGDADARLFHIDTEIEKYLANKHEARKEDFDKYVKRHNFAPEVEAAVCKALIDRIALEYPDLFVLESGVLECKVTGDKLTINDAFQLTGVEYGKPVETPYESLFDAICCQIPEDIGVVMRNDETNWNAAFHLCAPPHWSAEQKIGRDFFETHTNIPGGDKIGKGSKPLLTAMILKGPFIQFIWGVESDDHMNHHPVAPEGCDPVEWHGRSFNSDKFWVRVDRECTLGVPEHNAGILSIRTYFVPSDVVLADPNLKSTLKSALESMSPESRKYKGVDCDFDFLVGLLS